MEIGIAVILAFVLSTIAAYFQDQVVYNHINEALDDHEEVQDSLFAFCDNDLDELEARIEALEAQAQANVTGRAPGIYNEYGQQVFGPNDGGIIPVGSVENPFGDDDDPQEAMFALVDQVSTQCLDGTEGNEPTDDQEG